MSSVSPATLGSTSVIFAHDEKRACGTCRKRKVRCHGGHPCAACRMSARECQYPAPLKKKGPKSRSQHRSQLASEDKVPAAATPTAHYERPGESPLASTAAATHDSPSVDGMSQTCSPSTRSPASRFEHNGFIIPEQTSSPSATSVSEIQVSHPYEGTVRQLPTVVFKSCLELFFQHIHPIMPVLDRAKYLDPSFFSDPHLPPEEYQLLTSLAALTIAQLQLPRQTLEFGCSDTLLLSGDFFMRECLEHRRKGDHIGSPSLATIMTSFFLFGYFGNLDQPARAWYYLREAITFCQILGLDRQDLTSQLPKSTAQQYRKTFWLLYITERAFALQRGYRTSLTPSTDLPDVFDSEEPRLLYGFVHLAHVFRSIDQTFIDLWQKTSKDQDCSREWILDTHHALDASSPILGTSSEINKVDISVTRLWLHMLGWQISVQRQLLSSQAGDDAMKIDYPISISRNLLEVTCTTSQQVLDSHGIGLEQKIYDIANGLLDLLLVSARMDGQPHSDGRDYLYGLLYQLSQMRGTQSRYLSALIVKAEQSAGPPLLTALSWPVESYANGKQSSTCHVLDTPMMHPSIQHLMQF